MLRASSQGSQVDFEAITRGAGDEVTGVAYGAELIAYADAVVARSSEVTRTREVLRKSLGDAAVVDTAAVIANFQRMVRIADGTGIPLGEELDLRSADLRQQIGIDEFASAAGPGS